MKKIIVIIIAFSCIIYHSSAQTDIYLSIKETASLKSIEFASVSIKHKNIGTYSDLSGRFVLKKISDLDTIVIRHIGYKTAYIPVNQIKPNQIVLVEPYMGEINEVIVKPKKYDEKLIWSIKGRSKSTFSGFKGFELGTFIEDLPEQSIIKKIIIKTERKNNTTEEYYVKLHLYKVKKGKPYKEIRLSRNIFVISSKMQDIHIDIENENIMLSDSEIFVSMEWVGKKRNKSIDTSIKANLFPKIMIIKKKKSKTLYRLWNKDWQDFSKLPNLDNYNISIGVNLKIIK